MIISKIMKTSGKILGVIVLIIVALLIFTTVSPILILAEDTRQTLKLLNHLEISKPQISYHRHNEEMNLIRHQNLKLNDVANATLMLANEQINANKLQQQANEIEKLKSQKNER